jgi:hypothetical protein
MFFCCVEFHVHVSLICIYNLLVHPKEFSNMGKEPKRDSKV